MYFSRLWLLVVVTAALAVPLFAGAHEVYVLSPATIAHDIAASSPDPLGAIATNEFRFFFWGFVAFVVVTTVFFMSITHRLEHFFEPFLTRLRPWAPLVARVTLGVCLIASAYNHALFGPELPLNGFGTYAIFAQAALYVAGVFVLFGFLTRLSALLALVVFLFGVGQWGSYMLTYANYVGEIGAVLFLGGGRWSLDRWVPFARSAASPRFEKYAFFCLRVLFGVSVAFASYYAKFLHSNLALDTVLQYHLTNFFHFDPLFIVLGACIIEILMGAFFIFGVEIRHTALFFLFWLTLSLLYFGESVWPHLVLVGVNLALFMYGYDELTLEGRFFNRGKYQPVL